MRLILLSTFFLFPIIGLAYFPLKTTLELNTAAKKETIEKYPKDSKFKKSRIIPKIDVETISRINALNYEELTRKFDLK